MSYKSLIACVLLVQMFPVAIDAKKAYVPKGGLKQLYEYMKEQMDKIAEMEAEMDTLKAQNANMQLKMDELMTQNDDLIARFEELPIAENKTIVAIQAMAIFEAYSNGEIVKFSNIQTNVGLDNVDEFRSTGQFNCTFPGIYLVSFKLVSHTNYVYYGVYKNDELVNGLNSFDLTLGYHEKMGVFVFDLKAGDTVYVTVILSGQLYIESFSMITIVKID